MGANFVRFGLLATALLAMVMGASHLEARSPARTVRIEAVFTLPVVTIGMPDMRMGVTKSGMLGMWNCLKSGTGGMAGCAMQAPWTHYNQMIGFGGSGITASAGHLLGAGPPSLAALGRSLAPNPAPPKPRTILS